jgi:hypothetical protein
MAERNRFSSSAGDRGPSEPLNRDTPRHLVSGEGDWRGYDETVRRGPPLDTDVAVGDNRPHPYSGWGVNERAGFGDRGGVWGTDEPIASGPPDFGTPHAWGRESGWNRRGTGALRRTGPKGYKRSDDRIREDICEHLMDISDIDSSEVEVRVHEGRVTLEGNVPVRSMRYEIEDIAAATLGVQDVENNIGVPRREPE